MVTQFIASSKYLVQNFLRCTEFELILMRNSDKFAFSNRGGVVRSHFTDKGHEIIMIRRKSRQRAEASTERQYDLLLSPFNASTTFHPY